VRSLTILCIPRWQKALSCRLVLRLEWIHPPANPPASILVTFDPFDTYVVLLLRPWHSLHSPLEWRNAPFLESFLSYLCSMCVYLFHVLCVPPHPRGLFFLGMANIRTVHSYSSSRCLSRLPCEEPASWKRPDVIPDVKPNFVIAASASWRLRRV